MRHPSALAWLISFCLLFLTGLGQAAEPTSNSVGTLSWRATTLRPTVSLVTASQAAAKYLGLPPDASATPSQSNFVQITDSARYGNVARTIFYGWELRYSSVPIKNVKSGESGTIELTLLINGADPVGGAWPAKALVAAFTTPNQAVWQPPVLPERDYTQAMQADGWNLSRPQVAAPQSTIGQMLNAFWAGNGIDPRQAGQILLQPMQASPALPAKRSGGRLVPLLPSGLYWTVLVSGTKTYIITGPDPITPSPAAKSGERYMSGLVALYSDIGRQSVRGIYLP